jgi:hypothetical protein
MTLTVTLNDLVEAVSEFAHSDAEVVATVMHMLTKSRVRPIGDEGDLSAECESPDAAAIVHH